MTVVGPAYHAYTGHVVRSACCTGGRLCANGRVLQAAARVEEARAEYLDQAEWLALFYKRLADQDTWHGYCAAALHWLGNDIDAASISLDLAVAEASIERTLARVP